MELLSIDVNLFNFEGLEELFNFEGFDFGWNFEGFEEMDLSMGFEGVNVESEGGGAGSTSQTLESTSNPEQAPV